MYYEMKVCALQWTGGSTKCFSIEDKGSVSEASSRRVGGTTGSELAVGPASLVIDPLILDFGRGGWAN